MPSKVVERTIGRAGYVKQRTASTAGNRIGPKCRGVNECRSLGSTIDLLEVRGEAVHQAITPRLSSSLLSVPFFCRNLRPSSLAS
jgi:hypothetical protein